MAKRGTLDRVILMVLIAGAVAFALLLAGVGSGVLSQPAPYVTSGALFV